MAHLTVWKFDSAQGADAALGKMREIQKEHLVQVDDAAVVSWPADKKRPRTHQAAVLTLDAALDGSFWGLLFGLIFFRPFVGAAIGAAVGALTGSFADYGIDDELIEKVRAEITQGTSALFLLTEKETPDRIAEMFQGSSMKLIQSNLSREQEVRLRALFHD